MIEKVLGSILWLTDLFDQRRLSGDPLREEKRSRERRLVTSVAASAFCMLFVFLTAPGSWSEPPTNVVHVAMTVRAYVSLIFAAGALMALLWCAFELIGYWRFMRRVGLG